MVLWSKIYRAIQEIIWFYGSMVENPQSHPGDTMVLWFYGQKILYSPEKYSMVLWSKEGFDGGWAV